MMAADCTPGMARRRSSERSHEGGLLFIFFVNGFGQREVRTCDTAGLEAGFNRLQSLEAAEEEAGTSQQQK